MKGREGKKGKGGGGKGHGKGHGKGYGKGREKGKGQKRKVGSRSFEERRRAGGKREKDQRGWRKEGLREERED